MSVSSWDLGDEVPLEFTYSVDSVLTDVSTLSLTLVPPGGAAHITKTLAAADITHVGTGDYYLGFLSAGQPTGTWSGYWQANVGLTHPVTEQFQFFLAPLPT